jgi:hypothetical protein
VRETAATLAPTNNSKIALFQALPAQFDRAKYIEVATQLQIPESTADKQIVNSEKDVSLLKITGHCSGSVGC